MFNSSIQLDEVNSRNFVLRLIIDVFITRIILLYGSKLTRTFDSMYDDPAVHLAS